MLERVSGIAEREQAKAERDRVAMRRDYPGAAAAVDFVARFGRPTWVRDGASGREWGKLSDRIVPPVPGLPGGKVA